MEGLEELFDVLFGGVEGEAGAQAALDLQGGHEGHGAVVAAADGDALLVEEGGDVCGVAALEIEGLDAGVAGL